MVEAVPRIIRLMFVAHQKCWVDLSLIEEHFTGVKVPELKLDCYRISFDGPLSSVETLLRLIS